MLNDVKNAHNMYINRNDNEVDENNNIPGPSQSNLVEENISNEINYQEEKIKLNNESANKLIEEVQKIMAENLKLSKDLEKIKKKQAKEFEKLKKKHQKHQSNDNKKKPRNC